MKTWNIYSIGRRRRRMGKFVGQLKAEKKAMERAAKRGFEESKSDPSHSRRCD